MISIKRCKTPPKSLEIQKSTPSGTYNQSDVREQLELDFHGKCYICEVKPIQDGGEIEHLVAHKKDLDKKFDWNNLFLSCGHCNSVKNKDEYAEGIIDCTIVDPSELFLHKLLDKRVEIELQKEDERGRLTAKLIEECFNGETTYKRRIASSVRLKDLEQEMQMFYDIMCKYEKGSNEYYRRQIEALLQSDTRFTAFKRDYIRVHRDEYADFLAVFDDTIVV